MADHDQLAAEARAGVVLGPAATEGGDAAGKGAGEQLDHHRQGGAFVLAEGEQRPVEG
jgi:hypothetical protein